MRLPVRLATVFESWAPVGDSGLLCGPITHFCILHGPVGLSSGTEFHLGCTWIWGFKIKDLKTISSIEDFALMKKLVILNLHISKA